MSWRTTVAAAMLVAVPAVTTITSAEALAAPSAEHIQIDPTYRKALAGQSTMGLLAGGFFLDMIATHTLVAGILAGTATLSLGTVLVGAGLLVIGALAVWTLVRSVRGLYFAARGYYPSQPSFWDRGPLDYLPSLTGNNSPRSAPSRPSGQTSVPSASGSVGVTR